MAPRRGMVTVTAPDDLFGRMGDHVAQNLFAHPQRPSRSRSHSISLRKGTPFSGDHAMPVRAHSATRGAEPSSDRAPSLGAAVGFLLNRARQQKMTSMSSKRSRSTSSMAMSQRPCGRTVDASSVFSQRNDDGVFHSLEGNHNSGKHRNNCSHAEMDSHGTRHKMRRKEASVPQSKDASRYFSGLAAIPLPPMPRGDDQPAHKTTDASSADRGRARAQPIWCLVGTFKTSMDNVVRITGAALQWYQRNPKGGFQSMHVPLSMVTDIACARVAVSRDESTFSVVIKTAGKPSQVTFGFVRCVDAANFKASVAAAVHALKSL